MNAYSEEELSRGDFLRDQRRDAKMEKALREMLDNQPADNEKEVMLYALTYLQSNMSEDVAEDMMDYVSPDAIIEDEIVSAIESIATSLMCPAETRIQTNLCPKQPTTNQQP